MGVAVITGSTGLIGSEAARHFAASGWTSSASTTTCDGTSSAPRRRPPGTEPASSSELGAAYTPPHASTSATATASSRLFRELGSTVELVIHAAAQPSHDWAAQAAAHRLRHQRGRHAERARGDPRSPRPRRGVHLHLDQQGLRRPAELAAAASSWRPDGRSTPGHTVRERHPRGHVDRSLACTASSARPRSPPT